jgi:hypothetical protein
MQILDKRSPDQMFTKLLFAVAAVLKEDPSARLTSEESLHFLQSRDWRQVYADQTADMNLPDDPPEPIDENLPSVRCSTEGLALILDMTVAMVETFISAEIVQAKQTK